MNNLIKSFLENHVSTFGLPDDGGDRDRSANFEHFINYLAANEYVSRNFDPAVVGLGEQEVGIDGISIIINDDVIVSTLDEIKAIFEEDSSGRKARNISVRFVFAQAKSSEKTNLGEFSVFADAVVDFFSSRKYNQGEKANTYCGIVNYIFDHAAQLSANPDCHLVFAYTGTYIESNHFNIGKIEKTVDELKRQNRFNKITFDIWDVNKIIGICRANNKSIEKEIDTYHCFPLPRIEGVAQAHIAVVRCKDYISLISREDGAILPQLFEDNVRYFQGTENRVNAEIQATIKSAEKQQEFAILNNGITIVAKEVRQTGERFQLCDFQIVNGCQTSFVLYDNRAELGENAFVVLKIISTNDKKITDSIVKTTNRQTPVDNEAFETLRDLHKDLETLYQRYDLYYERRSKQYESKPEVPRKKIVSLPYQTAAYLAVFLGEPQSTHRNYTEILRTYKTKIYQEGDILEQYCVASLLLNKVDAYLREKYQVFDRRYRHHIALLIRCLFSDSSLPKSNSNEMKKYCDDFQRKLNNSEWFDKSMTEAVNTIEKVLSKHTKFEVNGNHISRSKDFTKELLDAIKVESSSAEKTVLPLKKGNKFQCRVTGWGHTRAWVEIIDYKVEGSIYIKYIADCFIRSISDYLTVGQIVEATLLSDTPDRNYGYELYMVLPKK